jgi:hypothetical protein
VWPAAGLGEVSTHPDFRRRGVAEILCGLTRDTFVAQGGQVGTIDQ